MKRKHILFGILLIISAALLSGCAGGAASAASGWPGVSVYDDTVYIAYQQHIYALNTTNGLEKWRFPAEADNKVTFFAAPVLTEDGQLLAGSYNNSLYSINPENGEQNWVFTGASDRYIGSLLATPDTIYAPTAGDELVALDLNGNLRWKFQARGALWSTPVTDKNCECVYVASMDHRIYALEAQSGNLLWETDDLGGSIVGKPALSDEGILYAGTFASEILAIDAQEGQILWRTPTNGWIWGGPTIVGDLLYFGDLAGYFYAVERSSGEIRWDIQPNGPISETPLVVEESIFFSTEAGTLYALDLVGNTRWSKDIGEKLYAAPVRADQLILVASVGSDELLFALDTNGNQQWSFTPEKK